MAPTPISWWKATSSVFKGILGSVGLALGVLPLFSQGLSDFLRDWWILGWALALAFFLTSAVLFDGARKLHNAASEPSAALAAANDTDEAELKRNELIADIATIQEWFTPFMHNGEARARLQDIPHPKYFSYDLCRAFEKLGDHFNDTSKELFTPGLIEAVDEARTAYTAYWGTLEHRLDAADEIQETTWNLKVMAPPGGGWEGETNTAQYESFYAFVRTLDPLMNDFLGKVAIIEKTARRLKVQVGLNTPQLTN